MIEPVEVFRFIDATLRSDTPFMDAIPGGLFRRANAKIPQDVFPAQVYCVYSNLTARDRVGGGGIRIGVNALYLVKVIGPGNDMDALETAAGLMDGLLQNAAGTTSTATVYYLQREQPFYYEETINRQLVSHLGGQYRTFVQKLGS